MPLPQVPPIYQPQRLGPKADAFAKALAAARAVAEDGTLFWLDRSDRLDCALVLAPEAALAETLQVAYVAMVAAGDALGALAPPIVAVTFRWPDRLLVNGAEVGGLRLAAATVAKPADVPDWLVVGLRIAMRGRPNGASPGRSPDRTNLQEEGCGEIDAQMLLESFSRHLLSWVSRWQDEGFLPVREAWLARAIDLRPGNPVALPDCGRGDFVDIDAAGNLRLRDGELTRVFDLAAALSVTAGSR